MLAAAVSGPGHREAAPPPSRPSSWSRFKLKVPLSLCCSKLARSLSLCCSKHSLSQFARVTRPIIRFLSASVMFQIFIFVFPNKLKTQKIHRSLFREPLLKKSRFCLAFMYNFKEISQSCVTLVPRYDLVCLLLVLHTYV